MKKLFLFLLLTATINAQGQRLIPILSSKPNFGSDRISQGPPPRVDTTTVDTTTTDTTLVPVSIVNLPFWDDFSTNKSGFVHESGLWETNYDVRVTQSFALKPPSIGVVTLDGLDSSLTAYDPEGTKRETLTSLPIKLDSVSKDTLFMTFFWQLGGSADPPEFRQNDSLSLFFKTKNGKWNLVWNADLSKDLTEGTAVIPPSSFSNEYLHNNFQFKFQRSGGDNLLDVINLDYIYIHDDIGDNAKEGFFNDMTISTPPTSIFGEYTHVNREVFKLAGESLLSPSKVVFRNLDTRSNPASQVFYDFTLRCLNDSSIVENIDLNKSGENLGGQESKDFLSNTPSFDPILSKMKNLDSTLVLEIETVFRTGDEPFLALGKAIDDTLRKIDLRVNDSARSQFTIGNVSAYDDGTAEYSYFLGAKGAMLAYRFDIPQFDTSVVLSDIQIHSPRFSGSKANPFDTLYVWNGDETGPKEMVYKFPLTLGTQHNNQFTSYQDLGGPSPIGTIFQVKKLAGLGGSIFVGYRQESSNRPIHVGFDVNSPAGTDKIYFNLGDGWKKNIDQREQDIVHGSLMIRVGFERTNQDWLPVKDKTLRKYQIYPTPATNKVIYTDFDFNQLDVFSLAGTHIMNYVPSNRHQKQTVTLNKLPEGVYLAKFQLGIETVTKRLIIK